MTTRIVVIGAGLGGLTAALALERAGFKVSVHEQACELGEVGAGLTLSRGTQHVFRTLGLQRELAPFATPAAAFPFLHYRTGSVLYGRLERSAGMPDDGEADIARQCHRADLHTLLAATFADRVPGGLHLDHRLTAFEHTAVGVRAVFANGDTAEGDTLVAADGIHSVVRGLLCGDDVPRFTGQVAYRFLVDAASVPDLQFGRGAVFLGPQRTFNRYSLRSGQLLNCVAIVATDTWTADGWAAPADPEELLAQFAGWHAEVRSLILGAGSLVKWGLFDRSPLPCWSQGAVTLLGDAAHAMLPFLGMGAALAIEDAMILARAFSAESTVPAALARYEAARRPRTALVHAKSIEQGRLTQARDPDRYDAATAPANDPMILGYDPVTAPI